MLGVRPRGMLSDDKGKSVVAHSVETTEKGNKGITEE